MTDRAAAILFLDIDGVVAVPGGPTWHGLLMPHPRKVQAINEVIERTGCEVVLSSSWRFCHGMELTQEKLNEAGARFTLIDSTPRCAQRVGELFIGRERGAEIAEWLEAHPEVERFAIIDDDADMGPLLPRLVRTHFMDGVCRPHVERLVELLGGRSV